VPGWVETASTLHLWTQMVGKTRLALAPMVNHWWQVPLYVTSQGLGTSIIYVDGRGLELELDFLAHQLEGRTTEGRRGTVLLQPQTVASFYARFAALLEELGVPVRIWTRPVEVPVAIPFEEDFVHRSYDPVWAGRFWRALLAADRVLKEFRAPFLGKASPVHFFWGSFDLAVTRFSGRRAPLHPGGAPNTADWVMQEAYSHEVSSAGFWPGSADSPEAIFYSYAYPEPPGFKEWKVHPEAARYSSKLGEFVLPYEAVRRSPDPDRALLGFLQSTYEAAAECGRWDRASLERPAVVPLAEPHAVH
jgi:hypothetical protein